MTVVVEVPAGYKWCKCCGGVFPKDTGFYQQRKVSKVTGETKLYPHGLCKKCNDARGNANRRMNCKPAACRRPQASLPDVAEEIIESAWAEAQIVFRRAGRLQWRASHREVPKDAEVIGVYNKGARYDCVLADISA